MHAVARYTRSPGDRGTPSVSSPQLRKRRGPELSTRRIGQCTPLTVASPGLSQPVPAAGTRLSGDFRTSDRRRIDRADATPLEPAPLPVTNAGAGPLARVVRSPFG